MFQEGKRIETFGQNIHPFRYLAEIQNTEENLLKLISVSPIKKFSNTDIILSPILYYAILLWKLLKWSLIFFTLHLKLVFNI